MLSGGGVVIAVVDLMDWLEPPNLCEQVLLHEESASRGLGSSRSALSVPGGAQSAWAHFTAHLHHQAHGSMQIRIRSTQIRWWWRPMGPRLHRSGSKPLKSFSTLTRSELWSILMAEVGGFVMPMYWNHRRKKKKKNLGRNKNRGERKEKIKEKGHKIIRIRIMTWLN